MILERSPILKVHRLVEPREVRLATPARLPDHVAIDVRAATLLTLRGCRALISPPVAILTCPIERVQVVHTRNDGPFVFTVRHEFDIEPFIDRTVRVELHDVFGGRDAGAFICRGALSDRLRVIHESHTRIIRNRWIGPRAVENRDDLCFATRICQDVFNRLGEKHLVASGNDDGQIKLKFHSCLTVRVSVMEMPSVSSCRRLS